MKIIASLVIILGGNGLYNTGHTLSGGAIIGSGLLLLFGSICCIFIGTDQVCPFCENKVDETLIDTDRSRHEYSISGMCKQCQNNVDSHEKGN